MKFNSTIFIVPGLGNSGEQHWQTLWEKRFDFIRVQQKEWETPHCEDWISTLDSYLLNHNLNNTILVGHSLACSAIGYWAKKYNRKIKGALLVAPSDTEAPSYPIGTVGFTPMPMEKLPFQSMVVMSTDDFYVSSSRAKHFAAAWGSDIFSIGNAGHINVASGYGDWDFGIELLKKLD